MGEREKRLGRKDGRNERYITTITIMYDVERL